MLSCLGRGHWCKEIPRRMNDCRTFERFLKSSVFKRHVLVRLEGGGREGRRGKRGKEGEEGEDGKDGNKEQEKKGK